MIHAENMKLKKVLFLYCTVELVSIICMMRKKKILKTFQHNLFWLSFHTNSMCPLLTWLHEMKMKMKIRWCVWKKVKLSRDLLMGSIFLNLFFIKLTGNWMWFECVLISLLIFLCPSCLCSCKHVCILLSSRTSFGDNSGWRCELHAPSESSKWDGVQCSSDGFLPYRTKWTTASECQDM